MTVMPLTIVDDSMVARAAPFTVTEWTPKRLVTRSGRRATR